MPLRIVAGAGVSVLLLAGCRPAALAPSPVAPASMARFVATAGQATGTVGSNGGSSACLRYVRFAGTAYPNGDELKLVLAGGSVVLERQNNKEFDDLAVRVEVGASRNTPGIGGSISLVLAPTVDSAGPPVTTWQQPDTLRVLLPWSRTLRPRWLLFFVSYRSISYDHHVSRCGAIVASDTLRFAEPGSP